MKTVDEHIWAVGEIASYNGGMCYQLSAPGTLVLGPPEAAARLLTSPEVGEEDMNISEKHPIRKGDSFRFFS